MGKIKDLTGQKFGKLTALYIDEETSKNVPGKVWVCECDCGKKNVKVRSSNLVTGKTKSCGCYRRESRFVNLTGKTFGELTVLSRGQDTTRQGHDNKPVFARTWNCVCSCGKILNNILEHSLKQGNIKSCGHIIHTKDQKYYNKPEKILNDYDLSGEYGIGFYNDKQFYFDLDDYEKIKDYRWIVKNDGYVESHDNKLGSISLHRIVMGNPPMFIDHINHVTYDCRKSNLRVASYSENQYNRVLNKNNTSGYKGVYFDNTWNKWCATISYNKNNITKKFDTIKEAIRCRKELEDIYHGDFSYENSMNMEATN